MAEARHAQPDERALLAALARAIAARGGTGSLAERLGRAATELMGAEGAAVTIAYTASHRVTLCETDDYAARPEDLQDVLGQGPGPTAYESGHQVRTLLGATPSDLPDSSVPPGVGRDDSRWPLLDAAVREEMGPVLVTAVPIRPETEVWGVLTCHQPVGTQPLLDQGAAQFIGDALGVALLRDAPQLTESPWSARAEIHQATGMVSAQLRLPVEDAVALLRAHAFAHNRSMSEVASAVLSRTLDFSRSDRDTDPANPTTADAQDAQPGAERDSQPGPDGSSPT
ncbi:ANTAR domain-containing protein [Terrabacter sp. BE26]|uniref:ANTAR domain-containing protein n=1 Tax=Terrabacter sp. BE26 TaxID=2898152 RepID=UPI0035BE68EB